jgi:glycosyltransferase involved in cell wall biosynthesis
MKHLRQIVTWQPVLTDHQAFTFAELSKQADVPIIAYVKAFEDSSRKAQGWADTRVSSIKRDLIPNSGSLVYCLRQLLHHRHEVHLFCGTFQDPILIACLLMATWLGIEFYLISEPYCPAAQSYFGKQPLFIDKLKAAVRPYLYKLYAGIIKNKVEGIFAISKLALHQYHLAGIAKKKLFPFGYFVPTLAKSSRIRQKSAEHSELRVVFVGSLIARKGLDILIESMRLLCDWKVKASLDVYGPGSTDLFAFDTPYVRYCGQIPFGSTQEVVSDYDLLVLPSRYDGWGVVINEALNSGVPVLCSDHAGASILTERFPVGAKFRSGDVRDLSKCLEMLANDRTKLAAMKQATSTAAELLRPSIAARYILEIILSPSSKKAQVPSPWYPE